MDSNMTGVNGFLVPDVYSGTVNEMLRDCFLIEEATL